MNKIIDEKMALELDPFERDFGSMTSVFDNVNNPAHYVKGFAPVNIECIDITRWMPFTQGNAFKYVWRAGKKGGINKAIEDLDKAIWYLNDAQSATPIGGAPPTGTTNTAQAIFWLLPYQQSHRFRALAFILQGAYHGAYQDALDEIDKLKKEIENENSRED